MCRWRRRENNRNVVVVVGIKVMEMQRSKKGRKERSRRKSRISFFVIKYAQFARQESVNRNWNNLLDNESGRK